ncbi:unnamed protein product [Prunus armeniaca]|uniref:Uncharacterized protein n=1 Tax=Prunus armeniaca TaxID=36596 RepID=A0A6J5XJJ5_PRUAR|nr:unnamed protein product [Prunus armeniaca]
MLENGGIRKEARCAASSSSCAQLPPSSSQAKHQTLGGQSKGSHSQLKWTSKPISMASIGSFDPSDPHCGSVPGFNLPSQALCIKRLLCATLDSFPFELKWDAQGQFGFERVFDSQGREFVSSPQYARSLPLSSVQLNVPPESRATWYTTSFVNSGYLEFKPHAEDKVISVCQMHRVVFTTHCLEDVNNEVDGDMKFQVKDLPTRDDFYPALHGMIKHKLEWGPQYQFYGRATFETGVAEWTKRVMSDFGDILHKEKIYGVVGISRYPYECCPNIWRAFCELCWGPLCNTFHHGNGEMGISLYDMKGICGLPILGDVQYEEFIPQNKDLQQNGVYPPAITELLKIHSQLCIYHNQSTVSWAQWIGHFYQEKIIYKASGDGKRKLQGQTLKAPEITLHISKEGRVAAFWHFG